MRGILLSSLGREIDLKESLVMYKYKKSQLSWKSKMSQSWWFPIKYKCLKDGEGEGLDLFLYPFKHHYRAFLGVI